MAEPGIAQLAHENRSSIEVSKNAKNEHTFAIKVYWDQDVEGAETLIAARIQAIHATLLRMFPV